MLGGACEERRGDSAKRSKLALISFNFIDLADRLRALGLGFWLEIRERRCADSVANFGFGFDKVHVLTRQVVDFVDWLLAQRHLLISGPRVPAVFGAGKQIPCK